jgi:hypothetical protein
LHIEPDAEEVVQGCPRRQSCSQAPQLVRLVRPLLPEAKGVEQLLIDGLYDLANPGYPAPQALRPHLAGVAFGRADDNICPIVLEPPSVIVGALKTLLSTT